MSEYCLPPTTCLLQREIWQPTIESFSWRVRHLPSGYVAWINPAVWIDRSSAFPSVITVKGILGESFLAHICLCSPPLQISQVINIIWVIFKELPYLCLWVRESMLPFEIKIQEDNLGRALSWRAEWMLIKLLGFVLEVQVLVRIYQGNDFEKTVILILIAQLTLTEFLLYTRHICIH